MNWMGTRKTTRLEDRAYCLLGICDVFMSPIHGEGTHAWKRLLAVVEMAENEEITTCTSKALTGIHSEKKLAATTVSRVQVVLPERKPRPSITPVFVTDHARKELLSMSADPCAPMTVSSRIASLSRKRDYTNYISRVVPSRTSAGFRDRSQIIWDATVDVDSVLRSHTVNGYSAMLPVAALGVNPSIFPLPVRLDLSMQRDNERSALFFATPRPSALGPVLEPKDLRAWIRLQAFSTTATMRCGECYKQIYTNSVVKCNNRYCSNPVFHRFCSGPIDASEFKSTWTCEGCRDRLTVSTMSRSPQRKPAHHGQKCNPKEFELAIEQASLECKTEFEDVYRPIHLILPTAGEASLTLKLDSSSSSYRFIIHSNIRGDHTNSYSQDDTTEAPGNEAGLLKMALSDDTRSDEELKSIGYLLQGFTSGKIHHCSDVASELESKQSAVSEEANIAPAFSQYHNPWEDYPSCPESKACPQRDLAHTLGDGVNQIDDSSYKYGLIDAAVSHEDILCRNPWAD
jgi:hypothetical protein